MDSVIPLIMNSFYQFIIYNPTTSQKDFRQLIMERLKCNRTNEIKIKKC